MTDQKEVPDYEEINSSLDLDIEREADAVMQEAVFGIDVQEFLNNHPVGRYINETASLEIDAFRDKMEAVDLYDADNIKELRRIKHEICVRRAIVGYLDDAINNGRMAESVLHEIETGE